MSKLERVAFTMRMTPNAHRVLSFAADESQMSLNHYLQESGLIRYAWMTGVRVGALPLPADRHTDEIVAREVRRWLDVNG